MQITTSTSETTSNTTSTAVSISISDVTMGRMVACVWTKPRDTFRVTTLNLQNA